MSDEWDDAEHGHFTRIFARYEYSRKCGIPSCQLNRAPDRLLCLGHAQEAVALLLDILTRRSRKTREK